MKSLLMASIVAAMLISAGSVQALPQEGKAGEADLEGVGAIQAVAMANEWRWSQKGMKNVVTPQDVIFQFSDGKVRNVPLPKEKMLVAIAPYIKETHPCATHTFSSCQGEMAGQTFRVKGIDPEGNVLADQDVTTLKNGFFELWLPRERKIVLNVTQGALAAEGEIETFGSSKTCVTTLQLR
ncbi:MAG: CueP family metal-binding protein [Deltaproteobacteria bacterium]|nr:CueP family metal-binding protein [Deltaproteobacteria bacterium]